MVRRGLATIVIGWPAVDRMGRPILLVDRLVRFTGGRILVAFSGLAAKSGGIAAEPVLRVLWLPGPDGPGSDP